MRDQLHHNQLPEGRPIILVSALVLTLTLAGSVWMYHQGSAVVRSFANEGTANLLKQMELLAMKQTSVMACGGLLLAGVLWVGLGWWRRSWMKSKAAWEEESARLQESALRAQRQESDLQTVNQELKKLRTQLESTIQERTSKLARECEVLQGELNERRLAEKMMAQTTSELARSKDVLEMHVQARTQELQKLQRQSESILNSAGEGIYGLDLRGKTTFVNPTAAMLTGWSVEDLVGKFEHEVFHHLPAGESGEGEEEKGGRLATERTFYRQDGSSFLVEYVRTPLKEKDREVGAVVMFKDITERKRSEEALSRKAAELARSNAELEQFAYVASHDLQEPLRKIQAFGDRLKATCDTAQLKEGRDYLERMQSAAARMRTLINDLLTFSRVISNSQPFGPVDLGDVAREVLSDLEVRIERTKARVEVGELPTVDADPMQMRQLLQNLIGNALKFSKPGVPPEVKVYASIRKNPLGDGEELPEEVCELCVEDNGIGFEEKYEEKIFAVFQRLHGRTEYEGTGVGLAVCRRITDRHEGTIQARSVLGKGTIFTVSLPVRQRKQEENESDD